MAIDYQKETLLTLTEATRHLPTTGRHGTRNGPHASTIWRWCRKGVNGTRLEYVRVGRRIYTSLEGLGRFFTALAESDAPPTRCAPSNRPASGKRSLKQKTKAIADAGNELDEAGI